MNKILIVVGSFVISVIMFAIPILLTICFVNKWNDLVTYFLILLSLGEFIILWGNIATRGDEQC